MFQTCNNEESCMLLMTCLHGGAHGKGKLTQWCLQDVEECQRDKDLLSIQNVFLLNKHVKSKHGECNLRKHTQTSNQNLIAVEQYQVINEVGVASVHVSPKEGGMVLVHVLVKGHSLF